MASVAKSLYTPEEYLALEREAEYRSEYISGHIYALAGAGPAHNIITSNLNGELRDQFKKGPCRVFATDMRVKVSASGIYTYPDVVAVCGERRYDDKRKDTLLNPTVLIEVLSPSTEKYDRGKKFEHYLTLETLQDYVLVAQDRVHIEHFTRQGD